MSFHHRLKLLTESSQFLYLTLLLAALLLLNRGGSRLRLLSSFELFRFLELNNLFYVKDFA